MKQGLLIYKLAKGVQGVVRRSYELSQALVWSVRELFEAKILNY